MKTLLVKTSLLGLLAMFLVLVVRGSALEMLQQEEVFTVLAIRGEIHNKSRDRQMARRSILTPSDTLYFADKSARMIVVGEQQAKIFVIK